MYSKQGALLQIVDGYKFKHLADGLEKWVCTNKECKAKLTLKIIMNTDTTPIQPAV